MGTCVLGMVCSTDKRPKRKPRRAFVLLTDGTLASELHRGTHITRSFFLNWDDTQTLLHYKLFPTRKDHVAFMAEQGRATKHLGRMHSHVLTLRSFAREILKPLKGLE